MCRTRCTQYHFVDRRSSQARSTASSGWERRKKGRRGRGDVLVFLDEAGGGRRKTCASPFHTQIISQRYENGSTIITTNRVFKKWPEIFNNDSTLTAAVLDRLLHHAETVTIEGKSFRMKDQIEEQ
jgi:DNA replication protein DnaC